MMKGWITKKIDDACEVEYGTRVVRKRDGGTIYPVYGGGGATFFMDTYNREDALVVARFAMSEECTRFVEGKFFLNDSGLTVTPKNVDELLPEFLNLQMLFLNDYIYSLSRGAAQRNLNVPAFRKTLINYPESIDEQQRIVSILDHCFEAIDKAKANAEQNLQNAKELYESYSHSVFENKGQGWHEKRLGEICDFVRGPFGGSLKKSIFKPEGNAVYEQRHAIYNQFDNIRYYVDDEKFNEMKRFELKPGNLIMSCSGTMGKIAIAPVGIKKGIINQALLKLEPSDKITPYYLKYWMESESFQDSLKEYSGGAAIQNVASVKILKQIVINVPSLSMQDEVVNKLDVIYEETQRLELHYQKRIDDLEELKKSILQKAFAGELKTDKMVEEFA